MTIQVKVPMLPESVSDATVLTWFKKPGDTVERDETIVELETDKVVLEVPAPEAGTIKEIKEPDGSTVLANTVLAIIEAGGATAKPAKVEEKPAEKPAEKAKPAAKDASPSVRRLSAEKEVDLSKVSGTGKGGRIVKEDVVDFVKKSEKPISQVEATGERIEKRVPMSRLRARVAERLVEAQQTAAMLTTFNEVDLTEVMALRAQYKDQFEKKHGVRLGFMSFFTRAACEALKRFPAVNASIDGSDIVYHGYYDVGIAVSTERGLVVPVIRDADQMSLAEIEKSINEYAEKARTNKLAIEDMQGGTFTITNGGVFGSLIATPILNPPQVAILGMHKIEQRPVVVDGEIKIRSMMYLALTYDHRIIDGKESVQFLVTIKQLLEEPARLLLDI